MWNPTSHRCRKCLLPSVWTIHTKANTCLISLPVGTVFHNFLPDINGMLSPQVHWRGEYQTRHLWKRHVVGWTTWNWEWATASRVTREEPPHTAPQHKHTYIPLREFPLMGRLFLSRNTPVLTVVPISAGRSHTTGMWGWISVSWTVALTDR